MARSLTTSVSTFALVAALGLATGSATAQDSLTVVSWGGSYGAAQKKHVIDPYQAESGVKVLFEDYSGGVAEIKAQVESGNIQWDVVDFEVIDLERACSEGLLETLDHSVLPAGIDGTAAAQDFIPKHWPVSAQWATSSGRWCSPSTTTPSAAPRPPALATSSTPPRSLASAPCANAHR
ncbi:hypothetical protein OMD46_24445 [Pseudomonas sp. MDMC_285]|nr:hypothetical protein [Pseudomonas sp. MDMC_285]